MRSPYHYTIEMMYYEKLYVRSGCVSINRRRSNVSEAIDPRIRQGRVRVFKKVLVAYDLSGVIDFFVCSCVLCRFKC